MIIGLTGSIASGKSTVARMLKDRGLPVVDADEIARLVVEPGSPVLRQIERTFGPESLRSDGSMDREYVGRLVFSDKDKRLELNAIIHPAIRQELTAQKDALLEAGAETVVLDIPLLFENKLHSYAEKILVVSVSPGVQLERLMARNKFTREEAEARISSQLPVAEKEAGADAVIYNNGTLDETKAQVDAVLAAWHVR